MDKICKKAVCLLSSLTKLRRKNELQQYRTAINSSVTNIVFFAIMTYHQCAPYQSIPGGQRAKNGPGFSGARDERTGRALTFYQLECFMILAQRLNFTQAAEELFMAQPALSRLISALEQELDIQLFYRNSRSVTLTPAGTAFLQRCPKILDDYRESVVTARLAQEGYHGSLTLGIMRDTFEPKLPTLYQRFHAAYPNVSLFIRGYSHSSLLSALERGEADAILNYIPTPTGLECPSILLHKNHQCVITSMDHPLASRGSVQMEELRDEPFVVMARTASVPGHDFIWKTAADAGFAPRVVAEATHVPLLLTLVSCGVGISTLSDDMACLAQGKVAFIPLLGIPFANVRLMWNEDNRNPALPHLLDVFRSIC